MTAQGLAIASFVLFSIYLAVVAAIAGRRRRRWFHVRRVEEIRAVWAGARYQLFDLVVSGKLDPRSGTFRALYHLQTFMMRRPDEYRGISQALQAAVLDGRQGRPAPWTSERSQWPDEMNEVLRSMSEGFGRLVMLHRFWWWLLRLLIKVASLASRLSRLALRMSTNRALDRLIRASPQLFAVQEFHAARREFDQLRMA